MDEQLRYRVLTRFCNIMPMSLKIVMIRCYGRKRPESSLKHPSALPWTPSSFLLPPR
jgi:hypothetical protein